jgi:hypothetical protein
LHINYRLDLPNISNKITQRYRLLHPTKEKETIYRGFISLQPKVDLKQFEEAINLGDAPIEFMNHSAALRETLSFNQHCTGSKGGYESATSPQFSSKNLDCQSKSGFYTEENIVTFIKDVKSNIVSIDVKQPKIYPNQSNEASSLVNIPTQHADYLAALRETLSFNQHCTGSKSSYVQAYYFQLLSKNPICGRRREGYFGESSKGKTWVYVQVMFGFNEVKYTEKMINTFRCSKIIIYIFTEGFHTEEKSRCQRTAVNNALLFFEQYHEASRRTSAEQMGSPLRSVFKFMLKYRLIPEPRIWDPVTLGNLVSIGNNQWARLT